MPSKEHFARNHEEFKKRWVRTSKVCHYPKIAACYITKDCEEFIEASIKSIYDFVSKIIVVDNLSKDKTLDILEKFNDPQKKITVISREFKTKTEQRNVYCQMLDGQDYCLVVDSDEVWDGENIRKVEHLIFSNSEVPAFQFNFVDFWKDLGHVSKGIWESFVGRKSLINLNLCGKIKYENHTLPVLDNGENIPSVFVQDIKFFHYSYVRSNEEIKKKIDYYIQTGTPGFQQQKDWYEKIWLGWDKNPIEIETKYGTHLFGGGHTELFTGIHPEVMKNHPRYLEYIDKYKLKINMSVFPLNRDGFVNISMKEKDIFNIGTEEKPFLILIEDLLEHISFNAVGKMLVNLYDKLEINGEVVIKILNLNEIIKRYSEGNMQYIDLIKQLYGEQNDNLDYHSCLYDQNAIKVLLEDVGFENITIQPIENNTFLYVVGRKNRELK